MFSISIIFEINKSNNLVISTIIFYKSSDYMYSIVTVFALLTTMMTDMSGQKVQTQVRLLLEEQSDQGLHCLLFHLHHFDKVSQCLASLFEF